MNKKSPPTKKFHNNKKECIGFAVYKGFDKIYRSDIDGMYYLTEKVCSVKDLFDLMDEIKDKGNVCDLVITNIVYFKEEK